MRVVTFEQIRESVRVEYDLPAFTTTSKPALADVDVMINKAAARLSGILIEFFGDDYHTTTTTIVTAANTSISALPTNFYKLRSLIWLRSADNPVEITRATIDDYADQSLLSARSWADESPLYRFFGASQVWWLPTPDDIYYVTCTYVASPVALASESDTVDAGTGWEDFIVNDVCRMIAKVREEDPGVYLRDRDDAEARIRRQAPERDPFASMQVRDARGARERRSRFRRWG